MHLPHSPNHHPKNYTEHTITGPPPALPSAIKPPDTRTLEQ